MNNWLKGLFYGLGIVFLIGFIGSFSSDPLESGEKIGSYASIILVGILGLYFGLRSRKKNSGKPSD